MQILEIRILRGPNYWSVRREKLIAMLLDLQEMENSPTDTIPGFFKRLKKMLPSLYEHRCSEGVPGGFFDRVQRGTWMGHVIEHIALEIQTLAGLKTGFGRTRGTGKKGVYHVVFSYEEPKAGKYAAYAAVRIAEALIKGVDYNITDDIKTIEELWVNERLGPTTNAIVQEAKNRNIPAIRLDDDSLVQLGYGKNQRRIMASVVSSTSNIGVEIAGDKQATKNLLEAARIPVPSGEIIYEEEELKEVIESIGYPLVTKPVDGNQGKGATTNITNLQEALQAFTLAKRYSRGVICEKFIAGNDYRALVINYKFVAAAKRTPASVTGNGKHTIQELIDQINCDSNRGCDHGKILTAIKIDEATLAVLSKKGYTTETILPDGEQLYLKPTANLSTGGTAADITDEVHPLNISLFERIARIIGLDICGIDIMAPDISTPIIENGGAILEVNAAPGFRMHLAPAFGKSRNVAKPVVDMLFPRRSQSRIPIIAITGTNGKTTTTRITAHIAKQAGHKVGFTTTDGVYIQDELVMTGDCSGPVSAQLVLKDPVVDFAVLETARGGILRAGIAFSNCDVAIVTNIAEDHLGLGGIDTIEKLARVKAVVAETVFKHGYAVLNAEDDLVYAMRENLDCNIALFAMNATNARVAEHCKQGGIAAVYEDGFITIIEKEKKIRIDEVTNIPITFNGKAAFNIANVLAAGLAAYLSKLDIEDIRAALRSFIPSPETTPGRLNIFSFNDCTVILDYAHNPHGVQALGNFVKTFEARVVTGIIAGVGDRRDEDIIAVGEECSKIFDELIVRQDKDLRGRTEKEICELLMQGIKKTSQDKKVKFLPDEAEALQFALNNAVPGALIVMMTENIKNAVEQVKNYQAKKNNELISV